MRYIKNTSPFKIMPILGILLGLLLLQTPLAHAALTDLASSPLVVGGVVQVKPNVMLMMDDSGSMAWDYMPDNGNSPYFSTSKYGYASAQCNGVFYNPSIQYTPPNLPTPTTLTGGATTLGSTSISYNANSSVQVGQTISGTGISPGALVVSVQSSTQATLNVPGTSTTTGGTFTIGNYPRSSMTAAPIDGFGTTTTSTINLTHNFGLGQNTDTSPTTTGGGPAYYYVYTGTQTTEKQKNFYTSSSTFYQECNSTIGSAPGNGVFVQVNVGTFATLTVGGSGTSIASSITVNGQKILSTASTASITTTSVAASIATNINNCTSVATGSCTVSGYSAVSSGSTVTISAPQSVAAGVISLLPVVTQTGTLTITPTPFAGSGPGNTDESTNFANWYSFYRTRILMMKSSSGLAFNRLNSNYRVGFATMNNNGGNKLVNISDFTPTQKTSFFTTLYGTTAGNSTPLLQALSNVGLLYAHSITTLNGVTVVDPIQYSCQQNFTILSTDGFWNDQTNQTLTAGPSTTAVGQQDGTEPPTSKQNDGSLTSYSVQTGTLQWQTTQKQTSATLKRSTNIQTTSAPLQWSTNFQVSTQTLGMWTDQKQTTAPLMISTLDWTSTTYRLLVSNSSGGSTGNASRNSTYNCITSGGAYGSNAYCSLGSIQSGPTTGFSTCTSTYNNPGTTTTDNSRNVVVCTQGTGWTPPVNVGAGGTCTASANAICSVGATTTSYVTNYPTPSCSVTANLSGTSTADASGNVVTACPVGSGGPQAMSSPMTPVPAGGSCNYGSNASNPHLYCAGVASSAATSYVGTYPPTCTVSAATWNAGTSTWNMSANASGQMVTGCSTAASYGPATAIGAGNTCNPALPNVACSIGAVGPLTYTTVYPPSCSALYTPGVANTANSSGNVATSCVTSGSWSTPVAVGAGGTCNGSQPNQQCSIGAAGTAAYVTTNPPTCTPFNATAANVADASGKVPSTCPVSGTPSAWANVVAGGSCTPSATTNCQYAWATATTSTSCVANASSGAGTWTVTTATQCTQFTTGGVSNTLADVAEYYYVTDLRTSTLGNCLSGSGNGETLCSTASPDPYNNVPKSGDDAANWQHMVTFTLGLGARGQMVFSPTYASDSSGDYFDINHTTTPGNSATVCPWQSFSGLCTWPTPDSSGPPANIDDLWHAAVDGRGSYYSATDPTALASGLTNALAAVTARTGTSAAATTSNPNITSGDNFLFSSDFVSIDWTGDLVRQQLNLTTGAPITQIDPLTGQTVPVIDWSARDLLDATTWASRNVYTWDASNASGNNLKPFTWGSLTPTEQAQFTQPAISSLTQLCNGAAPCLPTWQPTFAYSPGMIYRNPTGNTWYQVTTAYTSLLTFGSLDTSNTVAITGASGSNLVDFLDGDRSNEEGNTPSTSKYFRNRTHVLGDIVDSEAVYVKSSHFGYSDFGYAAFASNQVTRQGIVYVAANDGMLHGFYSANGNMDPATGNDIASGGTAVTGGSEAFAYIPKMVQPNLFLLADKNYKILHRYFTDGTPTVGDVCVSGCSSASTAVWKTIMVAGLNTGGRGYYALDITNPAAPKALWEFTDSNMGETFGNPVISKLANGDWVVLVTSGYNNVSPGDGVGRLYALKAYTGVLDTAVNGTGIISTGVGSTGSPSGLTRITAEVVDPLTNNTILQVYGGDLLGDLWRFDVNNTLGAGYSAQLLANAVGPSGAVQPITVKPAVGIVGTSNVVYFGTGRYLGTSDLNAIDQLSPNLQTLYGIYDPLTVMASPLTPIYANPRLDSTFVNQTLTLSTCPAGAPATLCSVGQSVFLTTNKPASIPGNHGWYVDLPVSSQRDNTDPALQLATLNYTTNIPDASGSACTIGGSSYDLSFDYRTGGAVSTAAVTTTNIFGVKSTVYISGGSLGNSMATRPIYVELPSGAVIALIRMGTGNTVVANVPIGGGGGNTRRVSWRELN